jgi:hypothetical protein
MVRPQDVLSAFAIHVQIAVGREANSRRKWLGGKEVGKNCSIGYIRFEKT